MTKKLNQEIKELRQLADFIEANPKEYRQGDAWKCVKGLGCRLQPDGTLGSEDGLELQNDMLGDGFETRYGISRLVTEFINGGHWQKIDPSFERQSYMDDGSIPTTADYAANFVRFIADQKETGRIF